MKALTRFLILLAVAVGGAANADEPLTTNAIESSSSAPANYLEANGCELKGAVKAAILVGGINSTYHPLDKWGEEYRASGYCVAGYVYDQKRLTLEENATELAGEIDALRKSGTQEVIIVAHSMGGLVSKSALDRLASAQQLQAFHRVELTTFGTPWGGFAAANMARWLPLSGFISRLIGKPMGVDIGSTAPFMNALRAPLPGNVVFKVYDGTADYVGMPNAESERINYSAVVSVANTHISLEGVNHVGFFDPATVRRIAGVADLAISSTVAVQVALNRNN